MSERVHAGGDGRPALQDEGAGAAREAQRQRLLLRVLLGDEAPAALAGWLHEDPRRARGLAAYRAHAGALAERALAAAYPTLQQLLGDESFAALARDFWCRQPPTDGDLGRWGGGLAAFVADAESLAAEAFLPDMARLEWAVHEAARAADAGAPAGLERLADDDPAQLRLQLAPGTALLRSAHPVASLWHAHRSDADDRFDAVRAALAAGRGEDVRVARQGWRVGVAAIAAAEARFIAALLARQSLAAALDAAGTGFDFEAWLIDALRERRMAGVVPMPAGAPP